jgi:predicted aldo/keto reductase-like oxidoreductase
MITRRFGRTNLQLPVLSLGGMRYQQSWRDTGQEIEPTAQQRITEVVQTALELGINHIETARGYGTSERQLGMLFRDLDREQLIIQTKIAPSPDPEKFAKQLAESFQRLQVDRIDLVALHGINNYEKYWWAVRPGGCLQVARRLQAEGKIGHVGFSTHGSPELITTVLQHEEDGGFDYVNLHWYYIWQYNWPAIVEATKRDIGVFIISPADKGGRLYDPPQKLVELCQPIHPLAFNTAFCLARPEVHTLSLGAAKPADFDLAVTAVANLAEYQNHLPEIEARLAQAVAEVVGPGGLADLFDGIPAWEDAPGYVNIRTIIWLRTLALAFGVTDYATERYNLLGNGGDWFPGANAAAVEQLGIGKAVKRSPLAGQIPGWLADAHHLLAGEARQRLSAQ